MNDLHERMWGPQTSQPTRTEETQTRREDTPYTQQTISPVLSKSMSSNSYSLQPQRIEKVPRYASNILEVKVIVVNSDNSSITSVSKKNTVGTQYNRNNAYSSTLDVHGGQKLMMSTELVKRIEDRGGNTNISGGKTHTYQDIRGGNRLMQLSGRKKKR